jgi:hypothetical protein
MSKTNINIVQPKDNPKRHFRSIRLDSDIYNIGNLMNYTLTNQVLQVLLRIDEGLNHNTKERAFTLTGPYGSGKSAFALFLVHLLANRNLEKPNLALEMLFKKTPTFATNMARSFKNKGLCPVVLTLRRAPLAQLILEGLLKSLENERQSKQIRSLISEIKNDLQSNETNSQVVRTRIETFINVLPKHYRGMILVLDELGKALEYAARNTAEDIYLLQELAEYASRSEDKPFILIGILHQSFEQYGEYLDHAARQEWSKVQGRFCDIAFVEPPEQQIRLAVQAIDSLGIQQSQLKIAATSKIADTIVEKGFMPNGLKPNEVHALAIDTLPLHPTVLFALPYLFKRFAQNERSLFAYLLSSEPFGLQEKLTNNGHDFIRLPDLFDYFLANVSGNITKKTYGRRWLEIADALERTPDLSSDEAKVLKAIGLLGILGEISFMAATREFISISLSDNVTSDTVQKCLLSLQKRSLIIYRRYNDTYKIWEGSDIDIEARLDEGRRKTRGALLAEDLQKFLPVRPMVARRHSHEVGAMRYFELRYIDTPVQENKLLPSEGMDGTAVCCLPGTQEQSAAFIEWAEKINLPNVLIVLPHQIGTLRDAATELRATHWVWHNTPELRDDRIARRELAERTASIERLLSQAVQHLLDPRPEPYGSNAIWYYNGQKQDHVKDLRGISKLLSDVMDVVYLESPRIKNELINRRTISAAAAGARRNLVERMLTNANEILLGIEGYPPERSIYESVLMVSELHRQEAPNWQIPTKKDSLNLLPTFKRMEKIIFGSIDEPCSVDTLLADLSRPPYGVMPGVFPILLVAFVLSCQDQISLYRENVFIPDPNIADYEVLMRRPELYAVQGSRLQGERAIMVERISSRLNVLPTTLSVARALISMVRSLPDHAWRTKQLPEHVLNLRTVIEQARSPERLLFVEIPGALNEEPFSDHEIINKVRIDRFFEKLNQAIQLWARVTEDRIKAAGDTLLKACNLPVGKEGWQELINTAHDLKPKPLGEALTPFVTRLTTENEFNTIIESVLALIANRPPRSWTDNEVEKFPVLAKQIGDEFLAATRKFEVLSPADEAVCKELIERLRKDIDNDSPSIVRVALSRLLQNY